MNHPASSGPPQAHPWLLPGAFALLKVCLHLPVLGRYGYHHDELYFLDCGQHLAFGYVDHAPLVPWIARLADEVFGQSLFGLRLFSVLAGAAAILLVGRLTVRLGGGWFGVVLACLSMLIAPVFLRTGTMLCIPAFEPLVWVACSYLLVRLIQEQRPRDWLWIGVCLGLGLMTKHSTVFLAFGMLIGMVLTPLRRQLTSPWPYLGGAVAGLIALPNLLWQVSNHWPTLEFLRNLQEHTLSRIPTGQFLAGQALYLHPLTAPVWLGGLVWYFSRLGRSYRILGWIYASALLVLVALKSKIYYLAPAYPALLAGGGVALEHFLARWGWPRLKPALVAALALGGLVLAPLSLPILSIDATERYITALTFGAFKNVYELTGDLHGQFGWKERAEAVAKVYEALPPAEREHTVIYANGYGVAGAVNYFGRGRQLPRVVSGHMSYYLWGLPKQPITTVIVAPVRSEKHLKELFEDVILGAAITLSHVNPWEREFKVAVCRRPKADFHATWPTLKEW